MRNGVQIGRVSARTRLSVEAIWFYEKEELLKRSPRTERGFRRFSEADIRRILFVRRAEQMAFSLQEICELLLLQRVNGNACSHVRKLLGAKVSGVPEKIRELGVLEQQLTKSLRRCELNLKPLGNGSPSDCLVRRAISHEGPNENWVFHLGECPNYAPPWFAYKRFSGSKGGDQSISRRSKSRMHPPQRRGGSPVRLRSGSMASNRLVLAHRNGKVGSYRLHVGGLPSEEMMRAALKEARGK
jgi:DNA-binding transcriptional MerR regulator